MRDPILTTPQEFPHWDDHDEIDDEDGVWREDECGLGSDGQCSMAGSEHCDFCCPNRDSELFAGSKAWCRAHGVQYRG